MSSCPKDTRGCPSPITILPFTNNTVFINNSINILTPIDNSNNMTGIYTTSASSYYDNTTFPFNAFNNDNTFWKSNSSENYYHFPTDSKSDPSLKGSKYGKKPYLSTNENNSVKSISNYQGGSGSITENYFTTSIIGSNIKNIDGEWLQIQFPNPILLTNYSIFTPFDDKLQYFPAKFTVVASNNSSGTDWNIIDSSDNRSVSSNEIPSISASNPSLTFPVKNNTTPYSCYRLIIESLQQGVTCPRITQWKLTGILQNQPTIKEQFMGNIGNVGNMNFQYHNFYPSLNHFSNFAVSEPLSLMNNNVEKIDNIENSNNNNYDYNKLYSGILFTILASTLVYIFVKSKK